MRDYSRWRLMLPGMYVCFFSILIEIVGHRLLW